MSGLAAHYGMAVIPARPRKAQVTRPRRSRESVLWSDRSWRPCAIVTFSLWVN